MNDRDEMASAPTGKPASIVSSPSGPTSAKNADSDKRVASQISAPHTQPPSIPDYELLRRIGGGSYGEVWLARSATGVLRAVKIVWRHTFEDDRPFQREFEGIQSFERLSREHPSQLALFHVGRGEGYFFYVMELADAVPNPNDECRNPNEARSPNDKTAIAPGDLRASDFGLPSSFDIRHSSLYSPRTLRADLQRHGRLPAARVLELGLALTEALGHLHKHGLIHRDIKPSNIIFVNGRPKLADIGLVTDAGDARSIVGTEGYLAPEGPGTPQADIFALGKVLYEATTGLDRRQFPQLPPDLRAWPDAALVFELNEILLKACAADPRQRYANAEALLVDLDRLAGGKSVRRAHKIERWWRFVRHGAGWLAVAACVVTLIAVASRLRQPPANPELTKRSTNSVANDQYDLGRGFYRKSADMNAATKYFEAALAADPNFGLAQAALATTLSYGGRDCFDYSFPTLSNALVIAKRALDRDDKLGAAHLVLAWHAHVREWDWKKATEHFEKAIRYAPANSQPHEWYGVFLSGIGRTNEAIRQLEMAERLNGQDVAVNSFFGGVLFASRRYPEAVRKFQKAAEMPDALGQLASLIDTSLGRGCGTTARTRRLSSGWTPSTARRKHGFPI